MIFLQITEPNKDAVGGDSGIYLLIIIGLFILWRIIKKMEVSSFLYFTSRKFLGASNPLTTHFLGNAVKKMIKDEGFSVTKIDIIHQLGNCYQGLAVINGEKIILSIIADKYGSISYES